MTKRKQSGAFDVDMTTEERTQLASTLCDDVQYALSARAAMIADGGLIDLSDWFYEQGRTPERDLPFPGAADLTSYTITEKVDSLRARLLKAVFGVSPFCFVSGWGADAMKAGYVEAFMDWQVRKKSTLQADLAKTIHGALIEDCYVLEVSEKIETRRLTETIDVAFETDPETGAQLFADGQPKLKLDEDGEPVLAQEHEAAAKVERTHTKTKRLGPQYEAISMKDFVFLPGHAKSQKQVWGYAKRFSARTPELLEKVEDDIYDADAVKELGETSDVTPRSANPSVDVAPQQDASVEHELFELSLKRDLDDDGREEWYVATISLPRRCLLRLKLDKFAMKVGRPRCVLFNLYPRRNSVYGYSFALDKLLTLAEEHTSLRNMKADRGSLATNKPIMQVTGGLWNPDEQPFGVGRVITVRDKNELTEFQVADVPNSIVEQEQALTIALERVSGLSDTAAVGTQARQSNTLGQDQMVARASAVRVDEVIGHLHLAIADVMALSHAIWVETLEQEKNGLDAPQDVVQGLEASGMELSNGKFTAQQITGDFHFEPYGSDETADPQQRQAFLNNKYMALMNLSKVSPYIQQVLMTPAAGQAMVEDWLRSYNVHDRQPFMAPMPAPGLPPGSGPGMAPPMGAEGQPGAAMPGAPMPGGGGDLASLMAMLQGGGGAPSGPPGY